MLKSLGGCGGCHVQALSSLNLQNKIEDDRLTVFLFTCNKTNIFFNRKLSYENSFFWHCSANGFIFIPSLAGAVEVKNDDFWDYDRQLELEGFDSGRVYDTLDRQARGVTQTIGQHKDSMKLMYQRLADQSESLKGETQGTGLLLLCLCLYMG